MTEFPNTRDHLAALAELDKLLRRHGVDYWLFGGWTVDFHAGRVTREHDDIDVAVWADDYSRLAELLVGRGWAHRPEAGEDGYTSYERGGVRLEVAFLACDEGRRVYTPLRDGRGDWPDGTFGRSLPTSRPSGRTRGPPRRTAQTWRAWPPGRSVRGTEQPNGPLQRTGFVGR
jgi:hypothetical protein